MDAARPVSPGKDGEVLVFAKFPQAGRSKTRLARGLGEAQALRVYRALLAHTLKTVGATPYRSVLFADPDESAFTAQEWAPGMDLYFPQGQGDLGARIERAVNSRLQAGARRIVVIGCDCPQISKESVVSSFNHLEQYDVVLGPAVDGGYYLLGIKAAHPYLFLDIPWSSENVLGKTLNILKFQSLSYILLDTFSDVDTWEDFSRVRHLEPLKNLGIQ